MTIASKLLGGAAGTAAGGAVAIEDVFSTDIYTGNGSNQAINTGLDMSGEGGLTWIKKRSSADNNVLIDTERGNNVLISDSTTAQFDGSPDYFSNGFSSTGFTVPNGNRVNKSGETFVSWSFRKAPKFFDVVTYTGNGTAGREIAHSLNSTVGMLMIKELGNANDWDVLHRSTEVLRLNSTAAPLSGYAPTRFGDGSSLVRPTSSVFTVGNSGEVNGNGQTYVAYLFAHETGDDSMIQCGSYAGNGNSTGPTIDLGWEPQWLLVKKYDDDDAWHIFDATRGINTGSNDPALYPNSTNAEASTTYASLNATGWSIDTSAGTLNQNNKNFIYVAIKAED